MRFERQRTWCSTDGVIFLVGLAILASSTTRLAIHAYSSWNRPRALAWRLVKNRVLDDHRPFTKRNMKEKQRVPYSLSGYRPTKKKPALVQYIPFNATTRPSDQTTRPSDTNNTITSSRTRRNRNPLHVSNQDTLNTTNPNPMHPEVSNETRHTYVFQNETPKQPSTRVSKQPRHFFETWTPTAPVSQRTLPTAEASVVLSNRTTLTKNRNLAEPVTLGDLEQILERYVQVSDQRSPTTRRSGLALTAPYSSKQITPFAKGKTAVPQFQTSKAVMLNRDVIIGSTIGSGTLGLILGTTISPNLWLVGSLAGVGYGYDLANKAVAVSGTPEEETVGTSAIPRFLLWLGRRIAHSYLWVFDFVTGMWFLYKTGQLSYEYYKGYSKLDDRFRLTQKMDAWNSRFQEGKRKFDAWEREHEIGRKVLASLRTFWLVEEESRKRTQQRFLQQERGSGSSGGGRRWGRLRQSKYRLVQYMYNVLGWIEQAVRSVVGFVLGDDDNKFFRGIASQTPRWGAALMAACGVAMTGSLFAVAPWIFCLTALFVGGFVWPTWYIELKSRSKQVVRDLKEAGASSDDAQTLSARRRNKVPKRKSSKKKKGGRNWQLPSILEDLPWIGNRQKPREPLREQWGLIGQQMRTQQQSTRKRKK